MSLEKVNLASIMSNTQKKRDSRTYSEAKSTLDILSKKLEENALSEYFSLPLTKNEKKFLKKFFNALKSSLMTSENVVPICSQRALKINLETARLLTLSFGVELVRIGSKLYLLWNKE